MKSFKKLLLLVIIILVNLCQSAYSQTATLLPNAEQQFTDANGAPYAGGSVYFYIPTTTSPKTTWQNAAGSVPNTNPVILDSAGRAIIYGIGQYRQILKDSAGNQVWDQLTQDVYSLITPGQTIWGGTATGTANALLLTSTPFITALVPGQAVSFIASANNTTAATANVSGVGVKNILVTTSAGTASVVSGNIAANGRYFMLYDGNEFILLNPTTAAGGNVFTTVASNTTTDIGTSPTTNIVVSGTNTITSFGSSASTNNPVFIVQFSSSLQITYNVSTLLTPNAQNLITQAGDYALMRYLGAGAWQVLDYFPASGYIGKVNKIAFVSPGTFTYTACNNLLYDTVEMVGAGGGSAGNGGNTGAPGGGAGGYLMATLLSSQVGAAQSVVIGAAGTAGTTAPGNGGNGGTTSIGTLLSCNGGSGSTFAATGGSQANWSTGGMGGTCTVSTGTQIMTRTGGQGGMGGQSGTPVGGTNFGGYGGNGRFGEGGSQVYSGAPPGNHNEGNPGVGNGSGGGGSADSSATPTVGQPGQPGLVYIEEYCLR